MSVDTRQIDTSRIEPVAAVAPEAISGAVPRRGAVSVGELQRAWRAVTAGAFRPGGQRSTPTRPSVPDPRHAPGVSATWRATGPVLAVVGCAGSVGASTVAVAVAEAITETSTKTGVETGTGTAAAVWSGGGEAGARVRVLDCAPASWSGLVSACTAELGPVGSGWTRGRRGQTVIDRLIGHPAAPAAVPIPLDDLGPAVTVVDLGWPLEALLDSRSLDPGSLDTGSGGWLAEVVLGAAAVVVVAAATVPGMRHLERTLLALTMAQTHAETAGSASGRAGAVLAVVRGPSQWPRSVQAAAGPVTAALAETGAVVTMPTDRSLAVHGLDAADLPRSTRRTAAAALTHLAAVTGLGLHAAARPAAPSIPASACTAPVPPVRAGGGRTPPAEPSWEGLLS